MSRSKIKRTFMVCLRCTNTRQLTARKLCEPCDSRFLSYRKAIITKEPSRVISIEEFLVDKPSKTRTKNMDTGIAVPETAREIIPGFVFSSPAMNEVMRKITKAAAHDVSILIVGESGVGKEVAAKAIHQLSARRDKPFIVVDGPSLSPDLASNELFGHEAGAFTGAKTATHGLFGDADEGTIFLDELSSLDKVVQPKLLRVLEDGTSRRVGGSNYKKVNVRVISATNVPLRTLVEDGRFRADLLYRLNVFSIKIPPLRERKEEIIPLAEHFLVRFGGGKGATLSREASDAIAKYPWPGNVRELYHAMQHAHIMRESDVIDRNDLPEDVLHPEAALTPRVVESSH